MKKLLLALDIGNVCVSINHLNCVRKLGLDAIPDELRQVALAYECGNMTEAEFFNAMHAFFQARFTPDEIAEAFDSILIEPVPGMEELVNSFPSRNIKAVFFSDISPTHLRRTREIFPAAVHVPHGIYSFESGALKPQAPMFDRFEAIFGKPDLYVDDRAELIAGAHRRNWHACCFTGAGALQAELKKLGF